jgi:hypothetical protein
MLMWAGFKPFFEALNTTMVAMLIVRWCAQFQQFFFEPVPIIIFRPIDFNCTWESMLLTYSSVFVSALDGLLDFTRLRRLLFLDLLRLLRLESLSLLLGRIRVRHYPRLDFP